MRRLTVWLGAAVIMLTGCSRQASTPVEDQRPASPAAAQAPSPDNPQHPKIVALGDSLTAGRGLLEMQAYPALLQEKLEQDGYALEVVNAGVSGDTSAAGLQRLDWALQQNDVRILILELGANDGLRGLPVDEMKKNLAEIIERARDRRIAVLLTGMEAPPNYGPEYASSFRQAYRDLGARLSSDLRSFHARQGRRRGGAEPVRRHPSEHRGHAYRGRHALDRLAPDGRCSGRFMIELHGVSRTVPSGDATLTILHPLDLRLDSGRVVAITGPSGSGKSTLLGLDRGPRRTIERPNPDRRCRHHRDVGGRARQFRGNADRIRLSVLSPAAVADGVGERACAAGDRRHVGCRPPRRRPARGGRAGGPAPSLSVAALRRRATARGDRAGAGERSADPAGRRADRQSRFGHGPSGHRPPDRA